MCSSRSSGPGKKKKEVGLDTFLNKRGKKDTFNYSHVKFDYDGWADPEEWLPQRFDLVILKTKSKNYIGWWNGKTWYSYYWNGKNPIEKWKLNKDY